MMMAIFAADFEPVFVTQHMWIVVSCYYQNYYCCYKLFVQSFGLWKVHSSFVKMCMNWVR